MANKILNYTTDVPVSKTIQEIQSELLRMRAASIAFDYDDQGGIQAVKFGLLVKGKEFGFKLPAKSDKVYDLLFKEKASNYRNVRYIPGYKEQSKKIAWRIVLQWLKAQMALIELEQVKPEEIFLPYMMVNNEETLFENMESRGFLLPAPKDSSVEGEVVG